jgi:hypothetical protein
VQASAAKDTNGPDECASAEPKSVLRFRESAKARLGCLLFSESITSATSVLPEVFFLFAWGGNEGHHTIFNVNNTLLGGSARPLLDSELA